MKSPLNLIWRSLDGGDEAKSIIKFADSIKQVIEAQLHRDRRQLCLRIGGNESISLTPKSPRSLLKRCCRSSSKRYGEQYERPGKQHDQSEMGATQTCSTPLFISLSELERSELWQRGTPQSLYKSLCTQCMSLLPGVLLLFSSSLSVLSRDRPGSHWKAFV